MIARPAGSRLWRCHMHGFFEADNRRRCPQCLEERSARRKAKAKAERTAKLEAWRSRKQEKENIAVHVEDRRAKDNKIHDPIDHVQGPVRPGAQGDSDVTYMRALALVPMVRTKSHSEPRARRLEAVGRLAR